MTICIAAIAKNKSEEMIVLAADRMVTTPIGHFEHTIEKFREINKSTVVMLAGNPLLFDDLVKLQVTDDKFESIKNRIYQNFKAKRSELIRSTIFNRYGINEAFFMDALTKPIPNAHISNILEQVSKFTLQTGVLLAGFDAAIAKISEINDVYTQDFRDINFHAIGSGSRQAINTLLFQKHSKTNDLRTTIYLVYKAKRNAEVELGVGKETDLLLLKKDGGIIRLNEKELRILNNIYEKELNFGRNHKDLLKIELKGV